MADPKDPQASVDAMALALGKAETAVERAMILIAALPAAIKEFHYEIGTHVTYVDDAYNRAAAALQAASNALVNLTSCHHSLDDLRAKKGLPSPGVEPLNGGGNGKP